MSDSKYPSIDIVRQSLRYEDGRLYWLVRPREHFKTERAWKTWNTRFSGKEAGHFAIEAGGERRIVAFYGKHIYRHVIVWAIHNGEWRIGIDHENRNSLDDRIGNLRIATQSQNMANATRRSDNTSGYKGVAWDSEKRRWMAQITVRGRRIFLGRFDDLAEANAAYLVAAREYFGEFATDGKLPY